LFDQEIKSPANNLQQLDQPTSSNLIAIPVDLF